MKTIDELERLEKADLSRRWAVSGSSLFEDNGPHLAHFYDEIPAELAAAVRNALPALLRVAEAAQVVSDAPGGTDEEFEAFVALRAALAELAALDL